ncbi:unnamed protein product [Ostreobium quekettii]|uniref:YTH domain-containing protein n=1 Tax=Ostreobium quekettii TaxID=121088 RepID=A0A8S1JDH8_9CHLO|nr:unnamed protein product [Ostreobium quekettii]|eukprot:evm.model.scf_319EXC.6 EVM.evm.TU.scf_319EXC.6   scf_319EXC:33883-38475(+)
MAEELDDEDAINILDDLLAEDYLALSPEPPEGHEGEGGRKEVGEKEEGAEEKEELALKTDVVATEEDNASPKETATEEPQVQAVAAPSAAAKSLDAAPHRDKNEESLSTPKQWISGPVSGLPPGEKEMRPRPGFIWYFIMKSNTIANIDKSVEHGVWSTQPHNEAKLNYAFQESDEVRLIFSVNQSGHFQGYARMASHIHRGPKSNLWVGSAWGGLFQVEWRCRCDLSFYKVEHLVNPLNEGKPVKIAKDGQEVQREVGDELVRLMEEIAGQGEGNPLRQQSHRPVHWWPGEGRGQRVDSGMEKMCQGVDRSRDWRSGHGALGRSTGLMTPPHEAELESLRGRVRSRSDEGSQGPGSPKRARKSLRSSPGPGGRLSPGGEAQGRQVGRSPDRGSSQQEGGPPHVFDLTYDQYLDYYCKVQSRISDLYSSGQLFGGSERGRWHGFEGNGHFLKPHGAGIGPSHANGRAGPGPMSEAQYVEYCANYFRHIGRPFNKELVRQHYWRMRSQYDRQMFPRSGG